MLLSLASIFENKWHPMKFYHEQKFILTHGFDHKNRYVWIIIIDECESHQEIKLFSKLSCTEPELSCCAKFF